MKITIQNVYYMPKELKSGVLYISKEFATAAHLCACGCMSKIRTPLGSTEWTLKVKNDKPSLYPSIGNWQLPCKSHYWIRDGEIIWANRWTTEQIISGRQRENKLRQDYFNSSKQNHHFNGILKKILGKIKNLLKR